MVLPRSIARELKRQGRLPPRLYEEVTVLFCDVVGFTAYSEKHPPEAVFAELEALVERFEEIAQRHGLEKIKTVGDAFMATAGLLSPHDSPVRAAVACGLDMIAAAQTSGIGLGGSGAITDRWRPGSWGSRRFNTTYGVTRS